MTDDPSFGPSGYLPDRAARRARKIVLREPLGLGWVVGSLLAGAVLVVTGLVFLLGRGDSPLGPPFVPAGTLDQVPEVGAGRIFAGTGETLLLLRVGQATRVFADPGVEVVYCTESRRLESATGAVWNLNGRLVAGTGESLQPLRFTVRDGDLFVNIRDLPPPEDPDPDPQIGPRCVRNVRLRGR